MAELHEVFGISRGIPKYTYVDRSGLDTKFSYLMKTERHIVIHGASKQGKSCLRRKNLDEKNCVIVQCLPSMSNGDVWKAALRHLGSTLPHVKTTELSSSAEVNAEIQAGANFIFAKGGASVDSTISSEKGDLKESEFVPGYDEDLQYLAKEIKKADKRLILEDFHYLTEDMRRKVAFDLKALYELEVYVLIIGIWSEQNLLTYYNGDLTGRIEEININWNEAELNEVLLRGEKVLNVNFEESLKKKIIDSSFQNVGLLQRLAEKLCFVSDVHKTEPFEKNIQITSFDAATNNIIQDIGQRYTRICEVFVKGFRVDTKLRIYYKIFKVLTTITEQKLIHGVPSDELLEEVQAVSKDEIIRQGDLTQCLDRIERLQAARGITPLLLSYNNSLKLVSLMDREFLFYRKFSRVNWDELVPTD